MSGILGILNLDGAPDRHQDLAAMASQLQRRGPDRTSLWTQGPAGLGHTLLTTTPELAFERQPVAHEPSQTAIVADVRLDNRTELLAALGVSSRASDLGDAGLILEAYLAWGEQCAERLLGDFAFAIWDAKRQTLFCARDQFGLRPLCYHYSPGRFFAFASEPRALLALPEVPCTLNEGRIADYLVSDLQWIDYTSTFFEQIHRLPPAHALSVTRERLETRHYWRLSPGPELRLSSNEDYAEALRSVLAEAVRSRLRCSGPVGSMLSGGLDSSSVVAIARDLLKERGHGPLSTFSGVHSDAASCAETRAIHAVCDGGDVRPHLIDHAALDQLQPHLDEASWSLDEPFDVTMALVRCVYMTAQRQGVRALLDGAGGDVVLNDGTYIIRQFRSGHWVTAWREARDLDRFYGGTSSITKPLRRVRAALTPAVVRRWGLMAHHPIRTAASIRASIISPEFARRVGLADRLRTLDRTFERGWFKDYRDESVATLHPNLTAGRERYDRTASAWAVEPRDPFLDRRVVEFCVTLPGPQRLHQGWPKPILRRAMAGRLPDDVLWRRGKPHLGWRFMAAVTGRRLIDLSQQPETVFERLGAFIDHEKLRRSWRRFFVEGDPEQREPVLTAVNLAVWLEHAAARPRVRQAESGFDMTRKAY